MIDISLGDGWQLYSITIPRGSRALGTVTRETGQTGVLILTSIGIYAQLNAGVVRSLPQSAVRSALSAEKR